MHSSTSVSSLPPARYAATFFAAALACLLVVLGFTQWAWERFELLRRISPMRYQLGLIVDTGPRVTALAIGDSHTALGFRPLQAGTMNGAIPGENIADMRLKLRYLLPRLPNLKLVLLQAQPHQFYAHRVGPADAQHRYLVDGGPGFHPFARWWAQFDPCCRAQVPRMAALAVLGELPRGYDLGILPRGNAFYIRHPPYPPARFAQIAAGEVATYGGRHADPQLVAEYETLIDELAGKGIRVVLAGYPLSESYWAALGEDAMREANALFGAIAARHRLRICGNWAPLPDALHLNPDHLSPEGAWRYANVIRECAAAP